MAWRFKACGTCAGDLSLEEDEWRCWQCGRYHYVGVQRPRHLLQEAGDERRTKGARRLRGSYGGLGGVNINAMLRSRKLGEQRWWHRNRLVIAYLEEGRSVREISILTQHGPRQIRVIRERWADMKVADLE